MAREMSIRSNGSRCHHGRRAPCSADSSSNGSGRRPRSRRPWESAGRVAQAARAGRAGISSPLPTPMRRSGKPRCRASRSHRRLRSIVDRLQPATGTYRYRAAVSRTPPPGSRAFRGPSGRCGLPDGASGCTRAALRAPCPLPQREFLIGQGIEKGGRYLERWPARERPNRPRFGTNVGERAQFRDWLVVAADDDAFPGERPIEVLGQPRLDLGHIGLDHDYILTILERRP
jgi:hypothetical protein